MDNEDFRSQIVYIRGLKDGWLWGKGTQFELAKLDWLEKILEEQKFIDPSNAAILPTADGDVMMEWTIERVCATLNINLDSQNGFFHALELDTQAELKEDIDLVFTSGWRRLKELLDKCHYL